MACSSSGCITRDTVHGPRPILHGSKFFKIPQQDALIPIHNSSLAAPMSLIPLDKIIHSLVHANLPHSVLKTMEIVPSGRLHMPFLLKCPDGNHLVLSLPPPASMRLLRSENSSIKSEAAVLQWLSGLYGGGGRTVVQALDYRWQEASVRGKDSGGRRTSGQRAWNLHDYLPKLTKHGPVDVEGHTLYNLSTPSLGVAVSTLSWPLKPEERRTVDFQSGQLLRRCTLYRSPNRRFGMAADVLTQTIQNHELDPRRITGDYESNTNPGSSSWSEAFHILLESVLRDAEDFTVAISYHCIRHHFKRFRPLLDCVTKSCLVAVDVGVDANTLVLRYEREMERAGDRLDNRNDEQDDKKTMTSMGLHGRIDVTGLREWSHCIFGDPLMAAVFSQSPSPDFLRGFHSPLQEAESGIRDYPSSPVEDGEYAHVRLLLYECYHTIVAIVQEFCRQREDSLEREMAGRKKLLNVLARLGDLDDEGNTKRDDEGSIKRKRPSMETAPAKRPKSEIY